MTLRPCSGQALGRESGNDADEHTAADAHANSPLQEACYHFRFSRIIASAPIMSRFLAIGHIAKDIIPGGYTIGGTVTYAAVTAHRLGYEAAILTRSSTDLILPSDLDGINVKRLPSSVSTTFENIYQGDTRVQYLHARADDLRVKDLPKEWRAPSIVLLGPLAGEVDPAFVRAFAPGTIIGVTPQGWMRSWDAQGKVSPVAWRQAIDILPHANALILSEQDIRGFEEQLQSYVTLTSLTVVTRGPHGARVYRRGQRPFDSPAFPTTEVDPTGAGDVFAAAFLIRLSETNDVQTAARFANCVASFSIEAMGVRGIPTRAQVEARLDSK